MSWDGGFTRYAAKSQPKSRLRVKILIFTWFSHILLAKISHLSLTAAEQKGGSYEIIFL